MSYRNVDPHVTTPSVRLELGYALGPMEILASSLFGVGDVMGAA